ncbi:MAG: EAL domain-containing protein [Aquificae bacterium]|nr:EAL domain-containing protein [Aquificota bacterium]
MSKKLFVFTENTNAEELERLAKSMGLYARRIQNIVIVETKSDEDVAYIFTEISDNALKDMRIYDGNFNENSCSSLLKAVARAQPPSQWLDRLIFNHLGKLFINTKILFHPIVDVKKKEVSAFEALCRPPIRIIDLIEVGRTSSEFSETYCRYVALKKASEFLGKNLMLFLNFHPKFLKDPLKVFGDLLSSLYTNKIKPNQIVIELTEYEELDVSAVKSLISFMKSEGVRVALDDVGSGYSGLFYLSELKPDIVKIDMELIRDIHKNNLKKVIVNYLIKLAHDSGILVVSEGVEKKEELETLVYMGTDYVQGFLISKPLEKPDLNELNRRVKKLLSSV